MALTGNDTLSPHRDASNGRPRETENGDVGTSSKALVPPYWSHRRYESYTSVKNTRPPPITLEDHTEEPSEQSDSLWAKGVAIDDYVLVSGNTPNVGNFIVYNCKIDTLDVSPSLHSLDMLSQFIGRCDLPAVQGGSMTIRKRSLIGLYFQVTSADHWCIRYSEFFDLQEKLLITFPNAQGAMPPLPPKSLICELY